MAEILKSIRILDLSQYMSGPYGTLLLADLGAEVIKFENPEGGELSRAVRQYNHKGESAYYLSFNRNKKSVTMNFKKEQAREIFYKLVSISDVVWDNFRPGILEKFKIDYESLKKINPKIISCSVTGFGLNSPYKDRPALDLLVQGMGGVMSFTGEPGRPPARLGYPMGDLGGGIFAVLALLAALYYREMTGKGQKIDISMLDAQISLMTYRAQYYFLEKVIPEPIGSGHVSAIPIRGFVARDGKYLTIEASHEKFFQNLCKVLEMESLGQDLRFCSLDMRLINRDALFEILEKKFLERNRDEWVDLLIRGDVPAGPVNNLEEALSDPCIRARNMVVSINHLGEEIQMVGNPIKMSEMGEEIFEFPPTLGQHTDEILTEYLGYSKEQISRLRETEAI